MQLLMRPDAEVLTILGTGRQGVTHYDIFTEMFSFKEVQLQTCLVNIQSAIKQKSAFISVGLMCV